MDTSLNFPARFLSSTIYSSGTSCRRLSACRLGAGPQTVDGDALLKRVVGITVVLSSSALWRTSADSLSSSDGTQSAELSCPLNVNALSKLLTSQSSSSSSVAVLSSGLERSSQQLYVHIGCRSESIVTLRVSLGEELCTGDVLLK